MNSDVEVASRLLRTVVPSGVGRKWMTIQEVVG